MARHKVAEMGPAISITLGSIPASILKIDFNVHYATIAHCFFLRLSPFVWFQIDLHRNRFCPFTAVIGDGRKFYSRTESYFSTSYGRKTH